MTATAVEDMNEPSDSYDEIPYESFAFPQAHPAHLAAAGVLFGMEPPALNGARVLEIGCACGGNLLPAAEAWPQCDFTGIDASAAQIARAREAAEALQLRNVKLLAVRLEELDVEWAGGKFDYIIAHGVYSWVAEPVRDRLMALCGEWLRPQGIAYVSFNTLPGARSRSTLRDMARYHTRREPDPKRRIAGARRLFAIMDTALAQRGDHYAQSLREEITEVSALSDFYLAHEHLEDEGAACYFHEFMEHSRRSGLQYLADAELQSMSAGELPPEVRNAVRTLAGNIEEAEQYQDFLRNRAFRQTLLCREGVPLRRSIAPELVQRFHFASSLQPSGEEGTVQQYRDADGRVLGVNDPLVHAALQELGKAWPGCISFEDLLAKSAARTGLNPDAGRAAVLARALLNCLVASRGMEFHLYPPVFHGAVSDFPAASPLARWQAGQGSRVVNLRHENVILSEPERALLVRLDGTRSVAELVSSGGEAQDHLAHFARSALLVS